MREFKFRAWDKMLRKWKTVEETAKCVEYAIMYSNLEDIELMQYTGLKDKNGKEIYEGDILNYLDDPHTRIVEWSKEKYYNYGFTCKLIPPIKMSKGHYPKQLKYNSLTLLYPKNCKIIGNIYENPELLK